LLRLLGAILRGAWFTIALRTHRADCPLKMRLLVEGERQTSGGIIAPRLDDCAGRCPYEPGDELASGVKLSMGLRGVDSEITQPRRSDKSPGNDAEPRWARTLTIFVA